MPVLCACTGVLRWCSNSPAVPPLLRLRVARDDSNNLQTLERDTDAEFNRVWQDLVAPLSSFAQPALGQTVAPFSKEMLGHLRHIPVRVHAGVHGGAWECRDAV